MSSPVIDRFDPGRPAYRTAALLLALAFTAYALAQIALRDLWMDEAWTLFLTDPTIGIARLVQERLSVDMHPPLFNVFLHTLRRRLPAGLPALRLVNLLPLLPAILYGATSWRRAPSSRAMLATIALLASSGMFFVHFAGEARVYWTLVIVSAVYALSAYRSMQALFEGGRADARDLAVLFVSSALLLQLHVYSAIFVTIHASANLVLLARHRRWLAGAAYLAWTLAMGLLLVAWYWFGTEFLRGMDVGSGWIPRLGLVEGARHVAGYWLHSVPNLALLALAISAVPALLRCPQPALGAADPDGGDDGTTGRGAAHSGRPHGHGPAIERRATIFSPAERQALGTLLFAAVLFSAGIVVGNLFTPLIVDRYFSVLSGPLALVVSVLATRRLGTLAPRVRGLAGIAVLAAALGGFAVQSWREPHYWNVGLYWGDSLRYALARNARCRAPLMHAASNEVHYVLNEDIALSWGAEEYARRLGFRTERAEPGSTLVVSADCPVALWVLLVQGGADRSNARKILDELRLGVSGARREDLELFAFGSQGVIALRR